MFGVPSHQMRSMRLPDLSNSVLQNLTFRGNGYMWCLRIMQFAAASVVLGVTIANAVDWHDVQCTIPKQLQINVLAAIISLPILLYFLFATGPYRCGVCPWSYTTQLTLDAFLLFLWISATPASSYTCRGVCAGCQADTNAAKPGNSFIVWVGKLTCNCSYADGPVAGTLRTMAVRILRQAKDRPGRGAPGLKIVSTASRMAAKQSFDMGMIAIPEQIFQYWEAKPANQPFTSALFMVTFLYTGYAVFQSRRMVRQRSLGYMSPMRGEYKDEKKDVEVTVSPVLPPRSP